MNHHPFPLHVAVALRGVLFVVATVACAIAVPSLAEAQVADPPTETRVSVLPESGGGTFLGTGASTPSIIATGSNATPISAPSRATLTAKPSSVTTALPLHATVPCADSDIPVGSPPVPPPTSLPVPDQDEDEEDAEEPIVSCDVGATINVSEGQDDDGEPELRVKICQNEDDAVTCEMGDLTFELEAIDAWPGN